MLQPRFLTPRRRLRETSLALPAALALLVLALQPAQLGGQLPRWVPESDGADLVLPGSEADERRRLAQIRGLTPSAGLLLRSPSALAAQEDTTRSLFSWSLLWPHVSTIWNSDIPHTMNNGELWAGRGWNAQAIAGFRAAVGPISVTIAPEFVRMQNLPFDSATARVIPAGEFVPRWQEGRYIIDLPVRHGVDRIARVTPGQSTVALNVGPLAVGVSTESHWWGPGVRNAIVLSNNAPGFRHAFLRTGRALRTPLGQLEARWIAGELEESGYFDADSANDVRALSAFAMTLQPAGLRKLTIGVARAVHGARPDSGTAWVADALNHWEAGDTSVAAYASATHDQILSLFGRWILPGDGAEIYAEWARHQLPSSLRDFLAFPGHSQGYTVGMQWTRAPQPEAIFRMQAEASWLEQSSTFRAGLVPSFYAGRAAPQGYTHRGQVIGAATGPGSSSQWLAADYISPSGRLGAYGGRIRWYNEAYFTHVAPWPFFGHDVSVFGGLKGGAVIGRMWLGVDWTITNRMNYLFQNWGAGWTESDRAIDVLNHTVGVTISPAPNARRRRAVALPAAAPDVRTPVEATAERR